MPSRARRLSQKIVNYLWWMSGGPASLSNAKISSIILKSDSVTENPINLSQRVLLQFDLRTLSATDMCQLMKIHGIKSGKAAFWPHKDDPFLFSWHQKVIKLLQPLIKIHDIIHTTDLVYVPSPQQFPDAKSAHHCFRSWSEGVERHLP